MLRTRLVALGLAILAPAAAAAQTAAAPDSALFDFWIGAWNVSWVQADGTPGSGTNRIERVLGGRVLQENFAVASGSMQGFEGKSWSVLDRPSGRWKQTWVDNQGAYLDFVGRADGERRIFEREFTDRQGKPRRQRMVFHDIRPDALTWDWESSTDGGTTWQLQWRILYERQR
jgi:hypothetical protein